MVWNWVKNGLILVQWMYQYPWWIPVFLERHRAGYYLAQWMYQYWPRNDPDAWREEWMQMLQSMICIMRSDVKSDVRTCLCPFTLRQTAKICVNGRSQFSPDKSAFFDAPFTPVNHGLQKNNSKIYIVYRLKTLILLAFVKNLSSDAPKVAEKIKEHKTQWRSWRCRLRRLAIQAASYGSLLAALGHHRWLEQDSQSPVCGAPPSVLGRWLLLPLLWM